MASMMLQTRAAWSEGYGSLILRTRVAHCAGLLFFSVSVSGLVPNSQPLSWAALASDPIRFSITIQNRKVDRSQRTLRVPQGAIVELAFVTDEAAELHLHGYDRLLAAEPGAAAVLRLDATVAGRFPIEAHRFGGGGSARTRSYSHVVLLYLEVHP